MTSDLARLTPQKTSTERPVTQRPDGGDVRADPATSPPPCGAIFLVGTLFTFTQWTGATHALLIWLCFVLLAVLNGGLRQRVFIPRMGEHTGHVVSTVQP